MISEIDVTEIQGRKLYTLSQHENFTYLYWDLLCMRKRHTNASQCKKCNFNHL